MFFGPEFAKSFDLFFSFHKLNDIGGIFKHSYFGFSGRKIAVLFLCLLAFAAYFKFN